MATLNAQRQAGAVVATEAVDLPWRLVQAPLSYVTYLWRAVWPVDLAAFYPQDVHHLLPFLEGVNPTLTFAVGVVASIVLARILWKKFKVTSFWAYLLGPGVISWFAFHEGGIHAALALVPLHAISLMMISVLAGAK